MCKNFHGTSLLNQNIPFSVLSGPPGCFRLPPWEVPAGSLQIQGVPAALGGALLLVESCVFG